MSHAPGARLGSSGRKATMAPSFRLLAFGVTDYLATPTLKHREGPAPRRPRETAL